MSFISRKMGGLVRGIGMLWQIFVCGLANLLRRLSKGNRSAYVLFELSGPLPERATQRPWYSPLLPFGKPALTVEFLHQALRRIAGDPDVRGVLLLVKGAHLSLAQAQSLADLFDRFRSWNRALYPDAAAKEVVVFLESCGNAEYMMAAAADRIFVPPLSDWMVVGLHAQPIFLADTLRKIGVQAEVVKVAPWKTAFDGLARSEISPAHLEQIERLLEGWYAELVTAIGKGRGISAEQVRSAIDSAPLTAVEAAELRLVDGIAYEDQLPTALAAANEDARILPFDRARRTLYRRPRRRQRKRIGVISLSGMITTGKSRRFPGNLPILGRSTVGSATVQQQVRAALENDRLAGVLLHIDSGGGSALASDLIWRELRLLSRKKPMVAYLGDVAASGGYYVALPAQKIVCQPATLTGSIGVITAKLITDEAFARIGAHRTSVRRGENADIYADGRPWRTEQRDKIEEQIDYTYRNFKERVADARQFAPEALEDICGGRVWTGGQARTHRLVDELGSFATAVDLLCELAGLPQDGSVAVVPVVADHNQPRAPLSQRGLDAAAGADGLAELTDALLTVLQGDVSSLLGKERIWLLADGLPKSE